MIEKTASHIKSMRYLLMTAGIITIYQNLVIRQLIHRLKVGKRQFNKQSEIIDYLLEVMNKNNIEFTEFDVIALTAITEE